jgi:hypothetical protein
MTELIIISFILALCAFLFATHAVIEVKAMQRSTHKVTFYNPADQEFTKLTDEARKELTKDTFDNI